MTAYLIIGLIYLLTVGLFAGFTVILFYHVGRYSLIGDASKRIFLAFIFIATVIVSLALILLIINSILP